MSYCRFSSDGFMCDVYVYADSGGGYTVHVASNRIDKQAPEIAWLAGAEIFKQTYAAHKKHMDTVTRSPLKSEHAGKTYNLETAEDMAGLLLELRDSGLNVPQDAIDSLMMEED